MGFAPGLRPAAAATPEEARVVEASEAIVASTPWLVPVTDAESLRPRILAETKEVLRRAEAQVVTAAAPTKELRVSREAAVIIIVCVIVVGVIILVALGAPHHP